MWRTLLAGGDGEPRHRGDGRQGLATKSERGDVEEIAVRQFGCRVALDGQIEVVGAHARAVVDDPDQPPSAAFQHDFDTGRTGIERVLDEFLHGGRRALDHLARSDAVHENRVEPANRHARPRLEAD